MSNIPSTQRATALDENGEPTGGTVVGKAETVTPESSGFSLDRFVENAKLRRAALEAEIKEGTAQKARGQARINAARAELKDLGRFLGASKPRTRTSKAAKNG